jgi:hypothetical protein
MQTRQFWTVFETCLDQQQLPRHPAPCPARTEGLHGHRVGSTGGLEVLNCKEVTEVCSVDRERPLRLGEQVSLRTQLLMCTGCSEYRKQLKTLRQMMQAYAEGRSIQDDPGNGKVTRSATMRLQPFPAMARALRHGRLADPAALKAALLGAPAYPQIGEQLRRMADPFPRLERSELAALGAGAFGGAYAGFMQAHQLKWIRLSPEIESVLVPYDLLAIRYLLLHDVFHVLLGFDVSPAGELGVWIFVGRSTTARRSGGPQRRRGCSMPQPTRCPSAR